VAPATTRNCEVLCAAIGHAEWMQDPRFATMDERVRHWDEFLRLIEGWTAARTTADCEAMLLAAGVPASRYRSAKDLLADPHYQARGTFCDVTAGDQHLRLVGAPFQLSAAAIHVRGWFPALGADTTEVLGNL